MGVSSFERDRICFQKHGVGCALCGAKPDLYEDQLYFHSSWEQWLCTKCPEGEA